jgi:uncharacterized protein YydD (DUF2326 family)
MNNKKMINKSKHESKFDESVVTFEREDWQAIVKHNAQALILTLIENGIRQDNLQMLIHEFKHTQPSNKRIYPPMQ